MITVFYDGKCGLCSKEILYYKKIAPEGVFDWKDLTEEQQALDNVGITLLEALKTLHVVDDRGVMHLGVDGFILIWANMSQRRWRCLGVLMGLPIIKQLADFAYVLFAKWRFKRLEHCKLAAADLV